MTSHVDCLIRQLEGKPLHPDHLANLRDVGITDETIRTLQIFSCPPGEIERLLGFQAPTDLKSLLVFPYPSVSGFFRAKVFPTTLVDQNGKKLRYLQPKGSGSHLYIPPIARQVLTDPYTPLRFSEGEKKSARACQAEIPTISIPGVWGFTTNGQPIDELNLIAYPNRELIYAPDSDAWPRPDLLNPAYAFGRELEDRGASTLLEIIPPGPDGKKRGLDDYLHDLERQGISAVDALNKLSRIKLKHKTFTRAAGWWKGWKDRQETVPTMAPPTPQMTPEEEQEALNLLKDPDLIIRFLDDTCRLACLGEDDNKAILYLAYTSRLLDRPVNLIVKGESSVGKNFLVQTASKFFPPEDVFSLTSLTPKSLHYMQRDLAHKVLLLAESVGGEDASYSLRSLQSEGEICIATVVKDVDTGKLVTEEVRVQGPVVIVETTTKSHLHPENETRNFEIFIDESRGQTREILKASTLRYGPDPLPDREALVRPWQNAQRLLKKFRVVIPYRDALWQLFPEHPVRVRRDFPRFLALIEVCTLLHQYQREQQDDYLLATIHDYAIARELGITMLGTALSGATPSCVTLIAAAGEIVGAAPTDDTHELALGGPAAQSEGTLTRQDLVQKLGWTYSKVYRVVKEAVWLGYLETNTVSKGHNPAHFRFVKYVDTVGTLPTIEDLQAHERGGGTA